MDSSQITVTVKTATGKQYTIQVSDTATIEQVKKQLESQCEIAADLQRLIYSGHIMPNDKTLKDYGVKDGHSVHMVRSKPPTPSSPSASTPQTQPTNSGMPSLGSNQAFGSPFGGATAGSPFGAMNGGNSPFGDMSELLESPLVQNMLNNEDFMRTMIENNPQLQTMIENNPELGHVLNDPATLRQAMQAMQNPNIMREMQRNADRAIQNIENHPEGFRLLRNMYNTMEGPLSSPLSREPEPEEPSQPTPPTPVSATPNSSALPNPWASRAGTGPASGAAGANPMANMFGGGSSFGGGGMPSGFGSGMGGGLGGMDPNTISQMMSNPAVQNMMTSMMSNPDVMQQMMNNNPMMQQMMNNNPQMRAMMSDPTFLQQLSNPQVIQAALQMQQSMGGNMGGMGGFGNGFGTFAPQQNQGADAATTGSGNTTSGTGQTGSQPDWSGLNNMMAQLMGGNAGGANPVGANAGSFSWGMPQQQQVVIPPEERFKSQLEQLKEMGFYDPQANINALIATSGNVNAAIERLLSSTF